MSSSYPRSSVQATTKTISPPPVYHPSVGGKFLASGPPPPLRNRPSTGKGPLAEKARPKPKSSTGGKGPLVKKARTTRKPEPTTGSKCPLVDKVRAATQAKSSRTKKRSHEDFANDDEPVRSSSPSPANIKKARVEKQSNTKAVSAYAITKDMLSGMKFKKVTSKAVISETCVRPALRKAPRMPYPEEYASGPKGSKWTRYEHEALYLLLVLQRIDEIKGDLKIKPVMDATLFEQMSRQLESHFDIVRTESSARNYWNRHGRKRVVWDERIDTWPGRDLVTSAQESMAASRS